MCAKEIRDAFSKFPLAKRLWDVEAPTVKGSAVSDPRYWKMLTTRTDPVKVVVKGQTASKE